MGRELADHPGWRGWNGAGIAQVALQRPLSGPVQLGLWAHLGTAMLICALLSHNQGWKVLEAPAVTAACYQTSQQCAHEMFVDKLLVSGAEQR